jgi:hypothetical protein
MGNREDVPMFKQTDSKANRRSTKNWLEENRKRPLNFHINRDTTGGHAMKSLIVTVFTALALLTYGIGLSWATEVIFFASNRAGLPSTSNFHIWRINPDGSGLTQVTAGDVQDAHPELSPGGGKLVFMRMRG